MFRKRGEISHTNIACKCARLGQKHLHVGIKTDIELNMMEETEVSIQEGPVVCVT